MMQWHITNRCNLRCAHCYQDAYSRDELPLTSLLNILDQFKDFIDQRRKQNDPELRGYITVVGGEPFARKDLYEILTAIASRSDHFSYSLLTNGSMLDKYAAAQLVDLAPGYVQLSLDGAERTHDGIRGDGEFRRAIDALRLLGHHSIRTIVAFTAHRGNFREFPEVARIAAECGVARIWADRMIPHGSGAALATGSLTPVETREFFELMTLARESLDALPENRTEVAMHRALQFLVGGGTAYRCTAGDTLFAVMPNGDLYPCRRMPVLAGNLLEVPLATLYEGQLFTSLREPAQTEGACSACAHVSFCKGGLKCLTYAVTGSASSPDPGCWLAMEGA